MADTKISALTALAGANVASDDPLPIVDTSVTTTKKINASELKTYMSASPTLVTPNIGVATGTSLDVSGVLESGANAGTGGQLKMFGSTSGDVTLGVAAAAGTATVFTLPATNGTNTYALTTNGSGVTSWNQIGLTTAVTGTLPVANGGTGITSFGTGVATAFGNNTNTAGGILVPAAALTASALVIGGGSGTGPSTTTTGTGVVTAIGNAVNASGGLITYATYAPASGKTLTVSNTLTLTGTDSSSVAFGTGGTVAYVNPRAVETPNSTQNPTYTIAGDTTDVAIFTDTYTAGISTITLDAPSGTPADGRRLTVRIRSTNTNAVSLSFNGIFQGSTDLTLPTTASANSKYDYLGFIYNSAATKWQLVALVKGFG